MGTDPGAPKRPGSAYTLWLSDRRQDIVKSLPATAKPTDVMKEAGKKWKSISAQVKGKYESQYKKAKADYDSAYAKYKEKSAATPETTASKKSGAKTSPTKASAGKAGKQ